MTLALTLVAFVAVALLGRRHWWVGFVLTLVAIGLASSVFVSVRDEFDTIRWGALAALALPPIPFRRSEHLRAAHWIFGAFLALALVSTTWSIDRSATLQHAIAMIVFAWVLLVVMPAHLRDPRDPRELVVSIATFAGVALVASVGVYLIDPRVGAGANRLQGIFATADGFGLFIGMTYPYMAAALRGRRWLFQPTLLLALALLDSLSVGRTGVIVLGVAVVVYQIAQRSVRRSVAGLAAIAVVVFSVYSWKPNLIFTSTASSPAAAPSNAAPTSKLSQVFGGGKRPAGQSRLSSLLGARDEAWKAAATLIAQRPALGYGFGAGDAIFAQNPSVATFKHCACQNAHDGYLQAVMELGVGSVLMLAPLALALALVPRRAVRRSLTATEAVFAAAATAAAAAAVAESIMSTPGSPFADLLWLAVVGALATFGALSSPIRGRSSSVQAADKKNRALAHA